MLTKKGKDLLKYVNDPKNKAKFKKNLEEADQQEMIDEVMNRFWRIRYQQEENKRIWKERIIFAGFYIFLGLIVWLTIW